MGKDSDAAAGKERRLEAAEWWVEFDSGGVLSEAQREAWLEWCGQPENRRAYDELAQVSIMLCALGRGQASKAEDLLAFGVKANEPTGKANSDAD